MLAFVHIHKTAGTTVNEILARSYGMRHCSLHAFPGETALSADDFRRLQRLWPPLVSISGHMISACSDLDRARPDVRYYTFLREPLVRCASHYQYQVQQQGKRYSFEDWIAKGNKRNPQTTRIAGRGATAAEAIRILERQMIFVGLLEQFDESLIVFRQIVADPRLTIWYRQRRVASSDDIKARLLSDPGTRQILIDANRQDLELYEHASRVLYPAFKRAYRGSLDHDVATFRKANQARSRLMPRLNLLANHYLGNQILNFKRSMYLPELAAR
jgi:hypothetical protein